MLLSIWRTLFSPREVKKPEIKKITGVINYLNTRKGYGFIESPQKDSSIFVHFNDCAERIRKGAYVKFFVEETNKGPRAKNVQILSF